MHVARAQVLAQVAFVAYRAVIAARLEAALGGHGEQRAVIGALGFRFGEIASGAPAGDGAHPNHELDGQAQQAKQQQVRGA